MFTLEEKQYLLKLLKKRSRLSWLGQSKNEVHKKLEEKLEQMIRNEIVNRR